MVRKIREVRAGPAHLALEAGAGDLKRAVGVAGFEANGLAIGETTILRLELAVDQPMGRTEVVAVARLANDRDLELGAVAEVVVAW